MKQLRHISDSGEGDEEAEAEVETTVNLTPESNALTEKYKIAELPISTNGRALHVVPSHIMAGWIQRVVEVESPIHLDEVARRIVNAVGIKRIGNRIQNAIKTAARYAGSSVGIQIKGEFLYWTDQELIIVRDRSRLPDVSRKLELIAPEEIEMAIKQIVSNAFGVEQNDLPPEDL